MIAGIGTDLCEVNRIAQKLQANSGFREHVFSAEEIAYCESKKNPPMHYAARWAAKEAYLKAYGLQFIGNHRLPDIETQLDPDGKPFMVLHGNEAKSFESRKLSKIHLSLSHTETLAIAYVILETESAL
jgi:holo-[acyl-carrier protein] synthase